MDDAKRISVSYVDADTKLNMSDPLVAAAARFGADGHYARELLAYRDLVDSLERWSRTAPAEPVVLLVSQRAVFTPGGALVLDEALSYLETGRQGGWDALYARGGVGSLRSDARSALGARQGVRDRRRATAENAAGGCRRGVTAGVRFRGRARADDDTPRPPLTSEHL